MIGLSLSVTALAQQAPEPAQLKPPANLFSAAQTALTDSAHADLRANWTLAGGALAQIQGNASTAEVRLDIPLAAGRPYLVTWHWGAPGSTGGVRARLVGDGTAIGRLLPASETIALGQYFPAAEVNGNFPRIAFSVTDDGFDATIAAPRVFDLSATDPHQVACDVLLCLGDGILGNTASPAATAANMETAFDGRIWVMPSLPAAPQAFERTGSLRHVPQPCMEPVQCDTGADGMSAIMACAAELAEWSAARGRPLLVLPLCRSGTGLNGSGGSGEAWRKTSSLTGGSEMYGEMLASLAAMTALGPAHRVIGAVVSLGAHNLSAQDLSQTWEPQAVQFAADLRAELGEAGLPMAWLTPGAHYMVSDQSGPNMISAIERLDQDSGAPVAVAGLKAVRPVTGQALGDETSPYFTAAGTQANGRLLGQALLSLLP